MAKALHLSCSTFAIISLTILSIALGPWNVHCKTLESDIQVLRSLKECIDPSLISSSSFVSTWNFDHDPCDTVGADFLGILCTTPIENNATRRITAIDLEGDGLEGFLTPAIGNLTELTTLNLSKNKFRGPLPNSISNLRKLTRLSLSENFFSGTIPTAIRKLKLLQVFDLSWNRLSGSIPEAISGLRNLIKLRLSNNGLSGTIPKLNGLWQLNTLDLSRNQLSGNLPALPIHLRSLLLSHNMLSGEITSMQSFRWLKTLDLSGNRLSGTIIDEVITLPLLTSLNLSLNRFTAIDVMGFTNRPTELRVLDVRGNRLQGHLPIELVNLRNLTSIDLGNNSYSGRIPTGYWKMVVGGGSWRSLFLDYNFLEGSLPVKLSRKGMRIRVSLAQNCLSCPMRIEFCRGGQRPASECIKRNCNGIGGPT